MKRFLTVTLALCLSLGVKAADAGKVNLRMTVTDKAVAGSAFEVKLTIAKGDLQGFARFHQDLPKGFEAEESSASNEGAAFSFADQRLRFIWANLPTNPEITIAYRIRVIDERIKGNLQLAGRFTYVVGDERQAVDIESPIIAIEPGSNVGEGQAISIDAYQSMDDAATAPVQTAPAKAPAPTPVAATPAKTEAQATAEPQATESTVKESNVFAVRQTPYLVGKDYYVNIQLTKGALTGFGKVEEELLVANSKVEAIETKGALFNTKDGKVSFEWNNMPEDNDFVIAYKVTPWQTNTEITLKGTFSFNNGGTVETVDIAERNVDFSSRVPVPPLASANANERTGGATTAAPADDRAKARERGSAAMQRGLVYKVQLLATKQPVPDIDAHFAQYNIEEPIIEEVHGFEPTQYAYKYVVGPFKRYEHAAQYRDQLWRKGITDAFVTCYYNGDRITIQEALLISNKKK
ncbi:MAG: hypothetical protein LBK47_08655 [Prevotellaceae bacterium]|jgi:hypothetical protein|nr:hypothetical protein [Prevotellaceae bacterium]